MMFWKKILEKLEQNQHVYLVTVVENLGSSPGRQGFKMFVSEDETIYGSIGGGIMEYQFVEKLKKNLRINNLSIQLIRQVHRGDGVKDSSGMICSGEQTVVFHPLYNKDIALIKQIVFDLNHEKYGVLKLEPNTISYNYQNSSKQYEYNSHAWFYTEILGYREKIYIIGGGHVGLATSKIMRFLNFHVIVIDNRVNLNTFLKNTYAHEKHIINYVDIENYITPRSYVAIMTSKYTDDKLILSKLIHLKHQYIGVLGSKSKMKTMFNAFETEGISKIDLNKIHTPIGFSIKSQTPEEIAISIGAQIIECKNKAF